MELIQEKGSHTHKLSHCIHTQTELLLCRPIMVTPLTGLAHWSHYSTQSSSSLCCHTMHQFRNPHEKR